MTSPVAHGYPDYAGFQVRANRSLMHELDTIIDFTEPRGRFFVGDVSVYGIRFQSTLNHFRVTVAFYDDEFVGNQLTAQKYSVRQGSTLDIHAPVGGPWVEISISPTLNGSIFSMDLWTASSPGRFSRLNPYDTILVSRDNNTVLAGATVVDLPTFVYPGEAHWFGDFPLGASFHIKLQSIDELGTIRLIDYVDANHPPATRRVFLPPTNIRVEMFNNDGVNRVVVLTLHARPIEIGS